MFQTLSLFINSNLIYDQANSNGTKTYKSHFSFEEEDEEDIYANLNNGSIKNENNTLGIHSSLSSSSYNNGNYYETDPDTNEMNNWLPNQRHKKLYKVTVFYY